MTRRQAVILMILATLMWSIAGVVTRQLTTVPSFEITFWRSFFNLLSLLIILPVLRGRAVFSHLRTGGHTLWISAACWGVMFTAFMLALTMTSVANVLVTGAIGPLLTALIARALIGQRVPHRTWWAIVITGLGMLYMHIDQTHWAGMQLWGTVIAAFVPMAAALNWVLVQRNRLSHIDLTLSILLGALLSALFTLPLAWPLSASGQDISWLALLGLVQLAIPCVLCVLCAQVLPASEMSLLALLEVIFGIALTWWGASEQPEERVLIGAAWVLIALATHEILAGRQKP